jgi:threonine dehydrogenase-like Zn-dependent dehydrogenase
MLTVTKFDLGPLITHRFDLEKAAEALKLWDEHPDKITKIILYT